MISFNHMSKTWPLDFIIKINIVCLLSICLAYPSVFVLIKITLLALILILTFVKAVTRGISINKIYLFILIIYIFMSVTSLSRGIGEKYVGEYLSTILIYPILFSIIFSRKYFRDCLLLVSLISTFIICVTIISFILTYTYNMQIFPYYPYKTFGLNLNLNEFEFSTPQLSSLIFTVPYLIFSFQSNCNSEKYFQRFKLFIICILTVSILISLVSGRRALQLVVVLSVSFYIIRYYFIRPPKSTASLFKVLLVLSSMVGILVYAFEYIELVFQQFNTGFDFQQNRSASIRATQVDLFLQKLEYSPIIGFGLGSYMSEYTRSFAQPYAYEMMYFYFIYANGYVITILYTVFYGFISINFVVGAWLNQDRNMVIAFLMMVLATGTNPYFLKFDYAWIYFLPLIYFFRRNKHDYMRYC